MAEANPKTKRSPKLTVVPLTALSALALAACVTPSKVYLPDGARGYLVDCSGWAFNWGHCDQRAGEICKERGYDVFSRSQDRGATMTATNVGVFGGTTHSRTILIKCRGDQPADKPVRKRTPGNPATTQWNPRGSCVDETGRFVPPASCE